MTDDSPTSKRGASLPSGRSSLGYADTPSYTSYRTTTSKFESIVVTYPPIFNSLLLQLPTSSVLDLYHTSRQLRDFLQGYPLAWNHLSFRSVSYERNVSRQASPASDASGEPAMSTSKLYALDQLLMTVVIPFGTRLTSVTLDHTAVSGEVLFGQVVPARREILEHLSVRGCKQVSLKYHIVPFLSIFKLQKLNNGPCNVSTLALKSLYAFRCRHHRRRPYTFASVHRRDSDSKPVHDLITICHELGIWTDSAWCPTPGGRCTKRKDYYNGRGILDARTEFWVVFDRLWRSGNRLGPATNQEPQENTVYSNRFCGRLWVDAESAYDGEPLGTTPRQWQGEGKTVPTHLRQSHTRFTQNIRCYDCTIDISERCEQCSIMMHCMGCRKTLCKDCAFAVPLLQAHSSSVEALPEFWWSPRCKRSPNLMEQEVLPSGNNTNSFLPNSTNTPASKMQWCCLKPSFSNSGCITFIGLRRTDINTYRIHAAPLPQSQGYEDSELARLRFLIDADVSETDIANNDHLDTTLEEEHYEALNSLVNGTSDDDDESLPRNLCQGCHQTLGWRAACQDCHRQICFAHDLRSFRTDRNNKDLNIRICGYKDLEREMELMEERHNFRKAITAWASTTAMKDLSRTEAEAEFDRYVIDSDHDLTTSRCQREALSTLTWPLRTGPNLWQELDDAMIQQQYERLFNYRRMPCQRPRIVPALDGKDHGACKEKIWRGCGAFKCPEARLRRDPRASGCCYNKARKCSICDVHVCARCLEQNPACDCSYCSKQGYACPNCYGALSDLCTKAEEEAERKKDALKLELWMVLGLHERLFSE